MLQIITTISISNLLVELYTFASNWRFAWTIFPLPHAHQKTWVADCVSFTIFLIQYLPLFPIEFVPSWPSLFPMPIIRPSKQIICGWFLWKATFAADRVCSTMIFSFSNSHQNTFVKQGCEAGRCKSYDQVTNYIENRIFSEEKRILCIGSILETGTF